MKIGIIGTGNMGRALGTGWARAGHDVLFGSRDPAKAKDAASDSAQSGSFDDAATFGSVVLYTVRDVVPSKLLRSSDALTGKILSDCTNSAILGVEAPEPQGRPGIHFETPIPSRAERLAEDVPGARVVKTFNAIPGSVIDLGAEKLRLNAVPVFLCADDDEANLRLNSWSKISDLSAWTAANWSMHVSSKAPPIFFGCRLSAWALVRSRS
jgi:predicted dinucleotide-binding enzyme